MIFSPFPLELLETLEILREIVEVHRRLERKVDKIMATEQDELSLLAQLGQSLDGVQTTANTIVTEVGALQQALAAAGVGGTVSQAVMDQVNSVMGKAQSLAQTATQAAQAAALPPPPPVPPAA